MMGTAADSFFCPVLDRLATKLHMSDEVAGRFASLLSIAVLLIFTRGQGCRYWR